MRYGARGRNGGGCALFLLGVFGDGYCLGYPLIIREMMVFGWLVAVL